MRDWANWVCSAGWSPTGLKRLRLSYQKVWKTVYTLHTICLNILSKLLFWCIRYLQAETPGGWKVLSLYGDAFIDFQIFYIRPFVQESVSAPLISHTQTHTNVVFHANLRLLLYFDYYRYTESGMSRFIYSRYRWILASSIHLLSFFYDTQGLPIPQTTLFFDSFMRKIFLSKVPWWIFRSIPDASYLSIIILMSYRIVVYF